MGARNAKAPPAPAAASERWRRQLARGASIELTARQLTEQPELLARLQPGTAVHVPLPPRADWRANVAACRRLRQAGLTPVPHLTARDIGGERELDTRLAALTTAGVDALLLIAGDRAHAAGPFPDSLAVLDSGRLAAHGVRRLRCAAHPERHAHADAEALRAALQRKVEYAAETNTELTLITQFAFAPAPILAWLDRMTAPSVSVRVGLAGPAPLPTLLKFAARCGIGASAKALTRRPGVVRLLGPWSPDSLLDALAEHLAQTPARAATGIHVFPFGGPASAVDWLRRQATLGHEPHGGRP